MKRSGRTLKQRLYGLKHLSSRLSRARYFRGHGVHSPYIYNIVRQVFMCSKLSGEEHALYDALQAKGVAKRRAIQLQNLVQHCDYVTWCIDEVSAVPFIVATLDTPSEMLSSYATYAREHGATLCVMDPYYNAERWSVCERLIDEHPSTTVDNRAYLLIFNNHLPLQRFRI